jgi:hypothetical protein
MLVDRGPGWVNQAECGSCQQVTALPFGLFVGSYGEPCGVIELCAACAPLADRLAERIAELTDGQASILFNAEAKSN